MRGSMGGFDSGRSSRRRLSSSGGGRLRKLDYEPLSTTEEVPELLKEQAEARLETGERDQGFLFRQIYASMGPTARIGC